MFYTPGLELKVVDQSTAQYYTYKWARVTDRPQRMDTPNLLLTEQTDYQDEHVHLHELKRHTDLQLLMAVLDDSPAAGLLLINNKNSYDIDDRFFPSEEAVWPVPVMVVPADTGKKIRSVVKESRSGVIVRVETTAQEIPSEETGTVLCCTAYLHVYTYLPTNRSSMQAHTVFASLSCMYKMHAQFYSQFSCQVVFCVYI